MYLIELISNVIKYRKRSFIALLINTALILLFYYLFFENSEIIYPMILSFTVMFIYFFIELFGYIKFQEKLNDSKSSPNYISKDNQFFEDGVLESIKEIHNKYLNEIYDLNEVAKERDLLFSEWIHNMKTSLTVIDLACEVDDNKNKVIKDIKIENNNLKNNLEQCLNIIRLEEFSKDYITKSYNLYNLVMEVLNKKKRNFIYSKVFPKVDINRDVEMYTDKKWFGYILEQIIYNSIKYSKEGDFIEFKVKEEDGNLKLSIEDTGIGIDKKDLKRIFEPFFTGENGRLDRNSTGIGLYMVKKVSEKLGHIVEVESEKNLGTIVKITI